MVDWWGLGILIHEMAVGAPPFNNPSNMMTMNDIVHEKFEPKDWLSGNLQNLLCLLLDKNPKTRLGSPYSGGVNSIKSHPFFEIIDWDKLLNKEYPAPINPKVKGKGDTKHISKMFLRQDIKNTPTDTTIDLELLKVMHFDNFTYNGDQLNVVEDSSEKLYDVKPQS
jgi:serine/threonine protein kinase